MDQSRQYSLMGSILSCALQFAACIWQVRTFTGSDLIGANLVSGLGGAISEIIVQITVADMFFVHQHTTMNGWFVIFETAGAFLGPVASGYIAITEGWRWMWWYCVIFLGVTLAGVFFFFEESKYIPVASRRNQATAPQLQPTDTNEADKASAEHVSNQNEAAGASELRPKSYRQRMALVTSTKESLLPHLWQPVVTLFSFPAVAYTAVTYGFTLAWIAILTSIQATYLIQPPYNFNASGVGLMNLAPFIGAIPGFIVGGYLSDKSIVWLSMRNGGIYEPEMRLWLTLPLVVIAPGGILMFGLGLAYEVHWSLLAVGFGVFGFDLAAISGLSLSYVMDCYQDIIGDSLVGVVFVRNILSVIVLFVLTPWVNGMGLQNLHILVAVLAFLVMLIPLPLLKWGKKARIATMARYKKMARNQLTSRTI